MSGRIVVKVGGSLFDLPQLGPRLRQWLATLAASNVVLVPGGGPTTDVIRDLDRRHGLGEEKSHWLALRALSLNARILADLLPKARVVESIAQSDEPWTILDPFAFCRADEREHPTEALPHHWTVTSDSIAARAAIVAKADQLLLLKSVNIPRKMSWRDAAFKGYVDAAFPGVIRDVSFEIRSVNFRTAHG